MKRRKFITGSVKAGLLSGAALSFGHVKPLMGANASEGYDLVAVKGGKPDDMFDQGIQHLGGLSQFIRSGQDVVVKPNIGWDSTPEEAADTNPYLVGRIVKRCFEAGAKNVYVFDHTADDWRKCYENSGIREQVKAANGTILNGNNEKDYTTVQIPRGKILSEVKVHEKILEADVFINVPVLKHHSSTKLTIGMKNLMGIIWDRWYWHSNGLNQCIADFPTALKPDLNIVDAYRVIKQHGPQGVSTNDVAQIGAQVISTDIVLADAAAAKFFGSNPADVGYIKTARDMGVGSMDLSSASIKRISA
jgi:uncharacterized protein (DUF362 family)